MKTFSEWLGRILGRAFSDRVTFDDGSSVEYFNREAILYREKDGRQMEVVWFFNPKLSRGRILHRDDINVWDAPHNTDTVDDQKKKEIEDRIAAYCQTRNIPLAIQ